ncbi:uncharacterized protein DDB_G0284459-like [Saccostrea cucullata]|uniref:uncharacterized protein DDB_G0284459-like n=1 Tax=Saccostrea cuccullata TaxID=36930 RepID=UPI002ED64946
MGCTCSTEAVPIVEIRQRRRTIKERIIEFFRRNDRRRENQDPGPQQGADEATVSVAVQVVDSGPDGNQEEAASVNAQVENNGPDGNQEKKTPQLPLPTRTYSDVSITGMIDIFEESRKKKTVSTTTSTTKRDDPAFDQPRPKKQRRKSKAEQGNMPKENSRSGESRINYKPPPEKPSHEKKLKSNDPSYRVDSSRVVCIGAIPSEEDISVTAEPGTSRKTSSGNVERSNACEAANKSYCNGSATRDLKQESARAWDSGKDRNSVEGAGTSASGQASTSYDIPMDAGAGPSTWSSPKMYGNSREQTRKEIEMALLAAENKPFHRPSYVIDTRDVKIRPKAAKGPRKPPLESRTSAPAVMSNLQSCVREFNRDVDRLFESQPQQTQPSDKPYDINKRPKAARGVRTLQTTDICGNTRSFSSGSYSLRPQLTMPGLRLPEHDALERFAQYQRNQEEQRRRDRDQGRDNRDQGRDHRDQGRDHRDQGRDYDEDKEEGKRRGRGKN